MDAHIAHVLNHIVCDQAAAGSNNNSPAAAILDEVVGDGVAETTRRGNCDEASHRHVLESRRPRRQLHLPNIIAMCLRLAST